MTTEYFLASVRRPRTLISILTFVSCVRGLLSPASLNMRARATLRGVVLLLRIPTNNKLIPTRDVFSIKNYINGHSWHLCFIDFSIQVCIRGWRWILPLLKLYCRYLYTRPCMINHIWGLKQLWLQVNGHAWFHLQRLRWPVRNGEGAKNSKWKYMSPAGFEPTPRHSTTGKLQRLRPLGHAG